MERVCSARPPVPGGRKLWYVPAGFSLAPFAELAHACDRRRRRADVVRVRHGHNGRSSNEDQGNYQGHNGAKSRAPREPIEIPIEPRNGIKSCRFVLDPKRRSPALAPLALNPFPPPGLLPCGGLAPSRPSVAPCTRVRRPRMLPLHRVGQYDTLAES